MRPSLLLLKAFVAVYEEHSFTGAAAREHATQPGISQHIRQLEEMLGVQFFERSKGRVDPTPAAHPFYARCVAMLKLHAEAMREAQQFRSDLEGEIRVGISPSLTQAVLGAAIAGFTKRHPNVAIRVLEGYPDVLTGMVLAEELDFVITPTTPCRAGITAEPFITMREVLVSKRSARFPHMKPLRVSECKPIRLILPGSHYVRRHALDAYFAAAGVDVIGVIEMDSVPGSLSVVLEGEWSTVLPSLTMANEVHSDRFSINRLTGPEIATEFSLMVPSRFSLTPAATMFSESLRAACVAAREFFNLDAGEGAELDPEPPVTTTA